jgi:hypothetical protein
MAIRFFLFRAQVHTKFLLATYLQGDPQTKSWDCLIDARSIATEVALLVNVDEG